MLNASYVINRSPYKDIEKNTCEEFWSWNPSNLQNLRVFEYVAYAHSRQGKFDPRVFKRMMHGYPNGVKSKKNCVN